MIEEKKGKIYFNINLKKQVDVVAANHCTSESCVAQRCKTVQLWLCLKLFGDKKQKQELVKCKSIIINFLLSKINITFSILQIYGGKKLQATLCVILTTSVNIEDNSNRGKFAPLPCI